MLDIQLFTSTPTNAKVNYILAGGQLPPGISITPDGDISGNLIPSKSDRTYIFTIKAYTNNSYTFRTYSYKQLGDPSAPIVFNWITNENLGNLMENTLVNIKLNYFYSGSDGINFLLTNGNLPTGLNVGANGVIYGTTPILALNTSYNFTITAKNSSITSSSNFTLKIISGNGQVG